MVRQRIQYITAADGLRVQQVGALPWEHLQRFVDDVVTVSEGAIADAVLRIAAEAHLIAEPSGATSVAGAIAHGTPSPSAPIVAVVTGANGERAPVGSS